MALAGLSKSEKDEHCVCFAALALHDGGAEINADSIKAMVEATGNEVEAYWPMIAAKFFTSGDNCKNLIVKPGGSGGGGGGGGGGGDATCCGCVGTIISKAAPGPQPAGMVTCMRPAGVCT